ncbi:MAG: sulfite dehydrogenase [Bryobacterales bacterium]|nr:sulfite dehydrogenase [Bryobacterales bacterium]
MKQANRRRFLALGPAVGGALIGCSGEKKQAAEEDGPNRLGKPISEYGERSEFEKARRLRPETKTPEQASSRTPLAEVHGMITPSSLHFERHHAGVPNIDPAKHTLMIHGLVERPLLFSVAELKRLPSVSKIYFIECAGNSGSEWGAKPAPDAQSSHGLVSCSEWTGVPLSLLLEEAGVRKEAQWVIAEGADACKMNRSVPIAKAKEDVLVAYAQNGEAIRPEQGYPLRLVIPGWEGNINVKWLRRLELAEQPAMSRQETSKYTDLEASGKARQFTFVMDAKSLITFPSGGQKLEGPGFYEVRGIAWSGRGKITKVEVSFDAGKNWQSASLQDPVLPMAITRFRAGWRWDGTESTLLSRSTDETGYVQPARAELIAVRGMNSNYHYNGVHGWKVETTGAVSQAVQPA